MYVVIDLKTGIVYGKKRTLPAAESLADTVEEFLSWHQPAKIAIEIA